MTDFPPLNLFDTIVFDFDGIFTDNRVLVDENGKESVLCDRADGLGLDIIRKYIAHNNLKIDLFVLSTESNPVVTVRAKKLKIDARQAIKNKSQYLAQYLHDHNKTYDKLIYLGNDLNDLEAIKACGFSVCPIDSHFLVKSHADLVLPYRGGRGFVRAFIEGMIRLDHMSSSELSLYL